MRLIDSNLDSESRNHIIICSGAGLGALLFPKEIDFPVESKSLVRAASGGMPTSFLQLLIFSYLAFVDFLRHNFS